MDPSEVIEELQRWDDLEFNPDTPNPPRLEVIDRKRNKLDETWRRETELCAWEDPERHAELKKLWTGYLERRRRKVTHFMEVSARHRTLTGAENVG